MYPPGSNNPNDDQPEEQPTQNNPDEPQAPPPNYYPPPAQQPKWQQPPTWQPPPTGQMGYGYPGYPKNANGPVILTLGILSLCALCCGWAAVIVGPIAWIMANAAIRDIDAGLADPSQRGSVVAGRICGIIGTCLGAIYIAVYVLILATNYHFPGSS